MSARDKAEALLHAELDAALAQVRSRLGDRLEIVEITVSLGQIPSSLSEAQDRPDRDELRPLVLKMRQSSDREMLR